MNVREKTEKRQNILTVNGPISKRFFKHSKLSAALPGSKLIQIIQLLPDQDRY